MIDKQRTAYMRIALGMVGVFQNDMTVETIWRIYEELEQKKGDLALRDVVKIESEVLQKYRRKDSKEKRTRMNSSISGGIIDVRHAENRMPLTFSLSNKNIENETLDPAKYK